MQRLCTNLWWKRLNYLFGKDQLQWVLSKRCHYSSLEPCREPHENGPKSQVTPEALEEDAKTQMKNVKAAGHKDIRWCGAYKVCAGVIQNVIDANKIPRAILRHVSHRAICLYPYISPPQAEDKLCKDFLNTIPLISLLGNKAMRPRHWMMLMKATGKISLPHSSMTLAKNVRCVCRPAQSRYHGVTAFCRTS